MPKVEIQKTYRVPLDKALEFFGNQELYDEYHKRNDATFTVLSREGNVVCVEVHQNLSGKMITFVNRTVYRLPRTIELETLSGPAKGSRHALSFESVPEGTKVTYCSDFKLDYGGLSGKALRAVSGKMMKKLMKESLEEGAEIDRRYLEGDGAPDADRPTTPS